MRHFLKLLCAPVFFFGLQAAHAESFDLFTFVASGLPLSGTATIAASPTPDSFVPGVSFTLNSVSATVDGTPFSGFVTFFSAGGVNGDGTFIGGDTLFGGPTSTPTFLLGNFTLSGDVDLGFGPESLTGKVTISQVAAVPELSTLWLAGSGALGVAEALRRRRAMATI